MKLKLVLVMVGLFCHIPSSANAETAIEVQSMCRTVGNATLDNQGGIIISDVGGWFCWGAFAALQGLSGLSRLTWEHGEMTAGFCAPPESTRVQLVKVFLKYADEHPEKAHLGFGNVAFLALVKAFPCPQP